MANEIVKKESQIVDSVIKRVETLQELGQIHLPKNYSAQNAVRAAFLVLKEKGDDLSKCTMESIQGSMFKMVVSGLSVAKGQGDFIKYGNKLNFNPEYHGNKVLVKRMCDVREVNHNTIYKKDVFEYITEESGRKKVTKHVQKIENINPNEIIGAYATVVFNDGTTDSEVMSMQQIKQAWMMGATKGNSPAHRNFPDRMAEKTVANRLMSGMINSSDDGNLFDDTEKVEQRSFDITQEKDDWDGFENIDVEQLQEEEEEKEKEEPKTDKTEENKKESPEPSETETDDPF